MANNTISLNEMLGIPDSQFEIVEIPIQDLVPYRNHKFRPSSDAKRDMIRESIKEFGVLEPLIVRPKEDIEYEILAGHQRTELSRQVGKLTVPAIIKRGLTDDEVEQIVAETNVQRSFGEIFLTYKNVDQVAAYLKSHPEVYNVGVATARNEAGEQVLSQLKKLETHDITVDSMSPKLLTHLQDVKREHALDLALEQTPLERLQQMDMAAGMEV